MERSRIFTKRLILSSSLILVLLILPVYIDNPKSISRSATQDHSAGKITAGLYISHSPIYIDNNRDFENDWPGEGTKDKPFIIEGLHIKSNIFCIKIVGTSAYFVIRNCLLENRDAVIDGKGIEIERVSNGIIESCIIDGLATGISLLKSQDIIVSSCQISNGKGGVRLEKMLFTEVSRCEISDFDYGFYASKVDHSSLNDNSVERTINGIIVDTCVDTGIARNVIQTADQGLSLFSSEMLNVSLNSIGDVRTGAFAKFTHNSSFLENVIQNADNGIFLESSNGNDVSANSISSTRSSALYVIYSWDTNIKRSEIVDNEGVGVYLYDSANCVLYSNYIGYNLRGNAFDYVGPATKFSINTWDDDLGQGNAWGGISNFDPYAIPGDRGSFDHYPVPILTTGNPSDITVEAGASSTIVLNASAVRPHYYKVEQDSIIIDEGTWDGRPIDVEIVPLDPGIYPITLLVNTTDGREMSHTLEITSADTTPPNWIEPPMNGVIEYGNRFMTTIEASDLFGVSMYWVNDTAHFIIDGEGNLEDTVMLDLGLYALEVRAYDPSMNFISSVIVITVQDTMAPEIVSPEDITYDEGDTGNIISWSISDGNPLSYQIYLNGELISEGGWSETSHILDVAVDGLAPGTHVYRLELYDLAGNSASDEVIVFVNPKSIETTTETTPTQTSEITSTPLPTISEPTQSTEPPPADNTMLITGIGGIAALGVVALILAMRKRK
ncbi:MAG: right-handed parallel beta-helix repeat-containing protein [Candidatus Thorarchaeota archaeon]|jgi:parallel beta-helix repeat protein